MALEQGRFRENTGIPMPPRGPRRGNVLPPITPGFLALGAHRENLRPWCCPSVEVTPTTHEGTWEAIVRSRASLGLAGVIVYDRTFAGALEGLRQVRNASRSVPVALVCDAALDPMEIPGVMLLGSRDELGLTRFVEDASLRILRRHAQVDAYAARCGCTLARANLLWCEARGLFQKDHPKALRITVQTKEGYLKDLRRWTGSHDLGDMVRIATETWA